MKEIRFIDMGSHPVAVVLRGYLGSNPKGYATRFRNIVSNLWRKSRISREGGWASAAHDADFE
ncbi:uncharacterized protein BJ212DRAFT_1309987 [Suillus subaureus]|uniref:Uncharacterized protein n=1 Tax=Suillus subaureus TaxID=48587 RepID=A0A9P7JK70_9AGAM|nr:uncharacterized protein BJ212DRAFT_1309987 [Suillus subaureus]KAG1827037.1 hypothetical protein BJ212DRAFT_1309987 [Suillus subaureus]